MRAFLFNCYGIPVPIAQTNDANSCTPNNISQQIKECLQDIASHCQYSKCRQLDPLDPIVYFNVSGLKLQLLRSSILRAFPGSQIGALAGAAE
ncbi:hypothetical protein EON64_08875 [archaeon]|nr:MAG: hypothetical protein EON64_08875 [archaeon]